MATSTPKLLLKTLLFSGMVKVATLQVLLPAQKLFQKLASTTTVATSATAKSSSTAQIASYTGAADAITAGTGFMGAALAFIIFL